MTIYRSWPEALPSSVEVHVAQIPGRGTRLAETPVTNMVELVKPIGEALASYFDKPFAFFGHSMGAIMSFELARWLRNEYGVQPFHLFVSGRHAPHIPNSHPIIYNLPEAEFREQLQRMNGTPKEVLEHPELMQLIMPILRADFQLCETHAYAEEPPLSPPITAFGGLKDETKREELEGWAQHTIGGFALHMVPGDHFFIRTEQSTLLRIISARLVENSRSVQTIGSPNSGYM